MKIYRPIIVVTGILACGITTLAFAQMMPYTPPSGGTDTTGGMTYPTGGSTGSGDTNRSVCRNNGQWYRVNWLWKWYDDRFGYGNNNDNPSTKRGNATAINNAVAATHYTTAR